MTYELKATCMDCNNTVDIDKYIEDIERCNGKFKSFKADLNTKRTVIYFIVEDIPLFRSRHNHTKTFPKTVIDY